MTEQAISILRQFMESGGSDLFYRDWGEKQWTLQADNIAQIEVTEPQFIQEDLDELVALGLLRIENGPDGNPIYHHTRKSAQFLTAQAKPKSTKLEPGASVGKWTLQKQIGKGGNGLVWSAIDANNQAAALKFLHSDFFGTQREQRFRDEIEFLRGEQNRPGILPLLGYNLPEKSTLNDRPWFATPFAQCFTTLNLAGPESLEKLVAYIQVIGQTLSALHNEQKFHRDLKPENLFLLSGVAVIGDFGLADFPGKDSNTRASENLGTRNYTAPELEGNAEGTAAGPADVYSLAKTVWALASGKPHPPQGHLRADTPASRISTHCAHPRSHVLDDLLERATNLEPLKRPTMVEFVTELTAWLNLENQLPGQAIDLATVTKEYQGTIQAARSAGQKRERLIQAVNNAVAACEPILQELAGQIRNQLGVEARVEEAASHPQHQFLGHVGGPQLIWNVKKAVKIGMGFERLTWLNTFVQVEGISDETVRVVSGHFIEISSLDPIFPESPERVWAKEIRKPRGSAELENGLRQICLGLRENFALAIKRLYERVNGLPR